MTSASPLPVLWFAVMLAWTTVLLGGVPGGAVSGTGEGDWLGALPVLYAGPSGSPVQELGLRGIVHLQFARVDSSQGTASESEFRRFRFGIGNLAVLADVLFGAGDHGQPDVFGVVLLSSYQIDARWELVGRYQFACADGENGLRLRRRYERAALDDADDQRGDRYRAAYLGVNYRLHGDQLRLMAGVEYAHMTGDDGGGDFDGWTWLAGVRAWF